MAGWKKSKVSIAHRLRYDEDNGQYKIYFLAEIYDNLDDLVFGYKLDRMGIGIEEVRGERLYVELPDRWLYIQLNKDEGIVVDQFGRTRLKSHRPTEKSIVLQRYTPEINVVKQDLEDGAAHYVVRISILDAGNFVEEHEIPLSYIKDLVSHFKGDEDALYHSFTTFAKELMNQHFPEWEDEGAYW